MRLIQIPKAYRQLRRFQQIVQVLTRHGFWDVLNRLGLASRYARVWQHLRQGRLSPELVQATPPQRFRIVLQELGPTFIKVGQFLSVRSDLLPVEWVHELEKLQDQIPPQPLEQLLPALDATHPRWFEWLVEIEPQPIGSASIAQVHAARTADGRRVAVKIRRPGIVAQIRTDLDILAFLADLADQYIEEVRPFRLPLLVEQARRILLREIDLRMEAQHMERFRMNMATVPEVVVPEINWRVFGAAVLVTERMDGIRVDDLDALRRRSIDPRQITELLVRAYMKQIFLDGFFHADPHPGNLWVIGPDRIAILDYGMVGTLDESIRETLADALVGVVRRDARMIVRSLIRLGVLQDVPSSALLQEVGNFVARYADLPVGRVDLRMILDEVFATLRRFRLVLPTELALMMKTTSTLDGLARRLAPDIETIAIARPFVRHLIRQRYHPLRYGRRLAVQVEQLVSLATSTPLEFEWFWQQFSRGQWPLPMELRNLPQLQDGVQRGLHRIAGALMVAGLMLGASLLMMKPVEPTWRGISIPGVIGWMLAIGWMLVIGWQILRSGKW